jgi:hypothetical protein
VLVVVFRGVNWPVMKMGIQHISPVWFAATRIFPGSLFLFGLLAFILNDILAPGVISGLFPILLGVLAVSLKNLRRSRNL